MRHFLLIHVVHHKRVSDVIFSRRIVDFFHWFVNIIALIHLTFILCIIRVVSGQLATSPVSVTEKAVDRYGWMKWIVLVMRRTSVNVIMMSGEHMTAITGKMSQFTAVKVSNFITTCTCTCICTCIVLYFCLYTVSQKTRQLSYRKEDRAMRPIYGCPEKFWESSLHTRLLFQKFVTDSCSDRY